MIPQHIQDEVALRVLETFLLLNGFKPCEWDENDPACVSNHGPHRLYTLCGKVNPGDMGELDVNSLRESLVEHIRVHNQAPASIKFMPYNVEGYNCHCGCGTFLYATIYN